LTESTVVYTSPAPQPGSKFNAKNVVLWGLIAVGLIGLVFLVRAVVMQ
jgi:hypothetical protein